MIYLQPSWHCWSFHRRDFRRTDSVWASSVQVCDLCHEPRFQTEVPADTLPVHPYLMFQEEPHLRRPRKQHCPVLYLHSGAKVACRTDKKYELGCIWNKEVIDIMQNLKASILAKFNKKRSRPNEVPSVPVQDHHHWRESGHTQNVITRRVLPSDTWSPSHRRAKAPD